MRKIIMDQPSRVSELKHVDGKKNETDLSGRDGRQSSEFEFDIRDEANDVGLSWSDAYLPPDSKANVEPPVIHPLQAPNSTPKLASITSPVANPQQAWSPSSYGCLQSQQSLSGLTIGHDDEDPFNFNIQYKTQKEYQKNLQEIKFEKNLEYRRQNLWQCTIRAPQYDAPVGAIHNAAMLPKDLYDLVDLIAGTRGLDFASVLLAVLGAFSCSLCGRYGVQAKNGVEPLLLYLYFAVRAETPVSSLVDQLKAPIIEFTDEIIDRYNTQYPIIDSYHKNVRKVLQQKKTAEIKQRVKESGDDWNGLVDFAKTMADQEMHAMRNAPPAHSVSPQLISYATKPKELAKQLCQQGGHLNIIDEAPPLITKIASDSRLDSALLTKAYDRKSHCCNDKNGVVCPVSLNMIAFDEPKKLADLNQRKSVANSGLSAVIAPCFMTQINAGRKIVPSNASGIRDIFNRKIKLMLIQNYSRETNKALKVISISPDAHQLYSQYENDTMNMIRNGQYKYMDHFLKRIPGLAVRLAGIIHAWQYEEPTQALISDRTMQIAIESTLAILGQADYVFRPDGLGACENAHKIIGWIQRHNIDTFDDRDVQQKVTGMRSKDEILPALDYLATHNIIAQLEVSGRSRKCVVHPFLVQGAVVR